jgi:YNFM family putative membrane transporter
MATTTTDTIDPAAVGSPSDLSSSPGNNTPRQSVGGLRPLRFGIYALVLASSSFQMAIVPLLPTYARRFGLSGFQEGMLLAATALSTVAVSLPAGALADRFGARRLTVAAGWLMAIAMLAEAFAPSFSVLLLSRLLFGAGYGIVWTAGLAWLAGVSPEGSGLGGTVACSGLGGIVGPLLAGSLAQVVGLAAPFLVGAVVLAGVTIVMMVMRLPSAAIVAESSGFRHSVSGILRNREIVAATAAVMAAGLTWSVSYLLVPVELHADGISTGAIGFVLSAAAAVFVIGSMTTSSIGSRLVRSRVIFIAIAAAALAFTPGVLRSGPLAMTAVLCGAAIARSVLWSIGYPLAAQGADRMGIGVGVVMGFLQAVWATTSVISPLAAGALTGSASPHVIMALTVVACLAVLSGAVAWVFRRQLQTRLRLPLGRAA